MTPEQRYEAAYRAAHTALTAIGQETLRRILAEDAAGCVIGKGGWGADHYRAIVLDEHRRRLTVSAVLRDLPDSVIVSSGPVDAAVKAAAEALLAAAEQDQP
jgi:hypothetical protein